MCIDAIAGRIGSEGLLYGVGYTLYNVGGSIPVGVCRAYEAIKELAHFYSNWQAYMDVKDLINVSAYKEHSAVQWLGYMFPEEAKDFWKGQLVRAIAEIVLPVIASIPLTLRDIFVTFVKEPEATSHRRPEIGKEKAGGSPFADQIRTNLFGRSEMAEMLAWRAAVDTLIMHHVAEKKGE